MIRIIISAIGTFGDIFPLLAVAQEFTTRGFRVSLLSSDTYRDAVERTGAEFVSLGTDEQHRKVYSSSSFWDIEQDIVALGYDEYFRPAQQIAFDYVSACHGSGENLLILTLSVNDGARIAADKYHLKKGLIILYPQKIVSFISPSAPLCWTAPRWLPILLRPLYFRFYSSHAERQSSRKIYNIDIKRRRRQLGIRPTYYRGSYDYNKEDVLIGFFPEWFGEPAKDWPSKLRLVGFPLFEIERSELYGLVDKFIEKNGRPVVFTAGSAVVEIDLLFRQSKEICDALGIPGIFVGGQPRASFDLQENFLHLQYVDFGYLFPKCRAVIHHGGIGTTSQAIKAGIPQLVRPIKFDQPDNALRILNLGLGAFLLPSQFKAEAVIPILKKMLVDPRMKNRLSIYADNISRTDAVSNACDLIAETLFVKSSVINRSYMNFFGLLTGIGKKSNKSRLMPLIVQKSKQENALACTSMLLTHYNPGLTIKTIRARHGIYAEGMTLKDMIELLALYGLQGRAFKCPAPELYQISLPAILFWNSSRFVVLQEIREEQYVIRDPSNTKDTYFKYEFECMFSEVVLEVEK